MSYPTGQTGTVSVKKAAFTIVYDATTSSYLVQSDGRSQSFAKTDRDATLSNATTDVLKRVSGNTTDTLALYPSTPGPKTLQYVGGAIWQRTIQGSGGITGSFDAATYGVEPPAAGVPRNGRARYDVAILGAVAFPTDVGRLNGGGVLTFDFLTGQVIGQGHLQGISSTTGGGIGPDLTWSTTAALGSTNNVFSGSMSTSDALGGSINGRLYGPTSQEVGAAFTLTGSWGGQAASSVGVMLGGDAIPGNFPDEYNINATITNPTFSQPKYAGQAQSVEYRLQPATAATFSSSTGPGDIMLAGISYDVDTKSYRFLPDVGNQVIASTAPENRIASDSNAHFDVYKTNIGEAGDRVAVFKPGEGNDELALTYTSFAVFTRTRAGSNGPDSQRILQTYRTFGIQATGTSVPTSGTAHYDGRVYATLVYSRDPALALPQLSDVRGTAGFDFNFGAGSFTGSMNLTASGNGVSADLGNFAFTDGKLTSSGFSYTIPGIVQAPGSGTLVTQSGALDGPKAQELMSAFGGNFANATYPGYIQGVIVAKCPTC